MNCIVDGKKIAEDVYEGIRRRVLKLGKSPVLTVITCAPNFETKKYLALKEKKAALCGIHVNVIELPKESVTETFLHTITAALPESDGIVVQLPLPTHIDTQRVIASIPESHDVDALHTETKIYHSPVVGACKEILATYKITVAEKQVTILGSGRLVGIPAYTWFVEQGAYVSVVTKETADIGYYTKNADIIVCGVGKPGLLTPEMIKDGVVILDAGTSEDGGELRGDADVACVEKSSVFTPVPGGIGPITVAMLLANVVDCAFQKKDVV